MTAINMVKEMLLSNKQLREEIDQHVKREEKMNANICNVFYLYSCNTIMKILETN